MCSTGQVARESPLQRPIFSNGILLKPIFQAGESSRSWKFRAFSSTNLGSMSIRLFFDRHHIIGTSLDVVPPRVLPGLAFRRSGPACATEVFAVSLPEDIASQDIALWPCRVVVEHFGQLRKACAVRRFLEANGGWKYTGLPRFVDSGVNRIARPSCRGRIWHPCGTLEGSR